MTICEQEEAVSQDQNLQHLMEYVIQRWLKANTNYLKISKHTRQSEMTWQLLIG